MLTGIGRSTVLVDDQQACLDWYHDVPGFEVVHDSQADGYRYLHIGVPGQRDTGLWLMPAGRDARPLVGNQTGGEPLLVLYTTDLAAVRSHLDAHGVAVWAVREDEGSRSLHLRDIVGNVLVVAELLIPTSG